MKKILMLILISISLFSMEKENISTMMTNKINQATSIIKQKTLSDKDKADKIFPLFDGIFDYKLMTKLSLGKANWIKMTPEQREEFTSKFTIHLKNSYTSKISLYTDEKLRIIGLKEINTKRVWLLTQLVGSKDSYDITYKFYKSKSADWLIYDVDILGVSLIKAYKSQFYNILQTQSYRALLGKIASK